MARVYLITMLVSAVVAVLTAVAFKLAGVDAQGWDAGIAGGVGGAVGAIMMGKLKKTQEDKAQGDEAESESD